jgi:hypothetical protein
MAIPRKRRQYPSTEATACLLIIQHIKNKQQNDRTKNSNMSMGLNGKHSRDFELLGFDLLRDDLWNAVDACLLHNWD